MLAPFLIMLREGIEAALIVGIIASYLRQTDRGAWLPAIWIGVFLAMSMSLFVGAGVLLASAQFPQRLQEGFEAVVGLLAVVILTWMVFWMRRAARDLRSVLQDGVDRAMTAPQGATWALIAMSFFAVAREGLESVFFLLAIFQQSPGPQAPLAALGGMAVAVAVGFVVYAGGVRIDLRKFFRITAILILMVAAGLLGGVLRNLHEAGVWNLMQGHLYDLGAVLPETGLAGAVLSGLFGYRDAPTTGEALVWAAYLAVMLPLFLWSAPERKVVA